MVAGWSGGGDGAGSQGGGGDGAGPSGGGGSAYGGFDDDLGACWRGEHVSMRPNGTTRTPGARRCSFPSDRIAPFSIASTCTSVHTCSRTRSSVCTWSLKACTHSACPPRCAASSAVLPLRSRTSVCAPREAGGARLRDDPPVRPASVRCVRRCSASLHSRRAIAATRRSTRALRSWPPSAR